jgi:hypothetical protein
MAKSMVTASQPDDPLEEEVGVKWQRLFGEPLPITGALDLAIGILRDLENEAADEGEAIQ